MKATKQAYEIDDLLPESRIIEQILEGETELFEILMRRHNQLLYRTVRSYFQEEADVEDIMQDTYLKAFEKLYQFHQDASFSTWLVRIGINEALQRKRKLKRGYNLRSIDSNDHKILQIPDPAAMNPEIKSMKAETSVLITRAIDQLPSKYKVVYMLKEVEGMEVARVAEGLQLSISNVKVRLHRARNMMKDSILQIVDKSDLFEYGNEKCDRLVANVMRQIVLKHANRR